MWKPKQYQINSDIKVVGRAGSGKTTWVFQHLESEHNLDPNKILMITFRRTHRLDLINRLVRKGIPLTTAQRMVKTVHQIAGSAIKRENPFLWGYDTWNKYSKAIFAVNRRVFRSLGIRYYTYVVDSTVPSRDLPLGNRILTAFDSILGMTGDEEKLLDVDFLYQISRVVGVDDVMPNLLYQSFESLLSEYEKNKVMSYAQSLIYYTNLGWSLDDIRENEIESVFVDEINDFNYILSRAVDAISRGKELIVAGDPYQAIYSFMGGHPQYLLDAGGREVFLNKTYRFGGQVGEVVSRFLSSKFGEDGFVVSSTPTIYEMRGFFEFLDYVMNTNESVHYLAYTNRECQLLQERLLQSGVPAIVMNTNEQMGNLHKHIKIYQRAVSFVKYGKADKRLMDFLDLDKFNAFEYRENIRDNPMRFASDVVDKLGEEKLSKVERLFWLQLVPKLQWSRIDSNNFVSISTIHSFKGAESDNVALSLIIPQSVQRSAMVEEELRKELDRIAYVGITRARKKLMIILNSPLAKGMDYMW